MRTRLWLWWHRRHGQVILVRGHSTRWGDRSARGVYVCPCGVERPRG